MRTEKHINLKSLNKNRERLTVNYFFNRRLYIFWMIFCGVLTIGAGVAAYIFSNKTFDATPGRRLHFVFAIVCAILALLTILIAIRFFSTYINHVTLDYLIKKDRDVAFNGLLNHLAINNNRNEFVEDPIEVVAPRMYPGRNKILYRFDKENKKMYYSQTGYTWLLFSERNIFLYQVAVNHIHGLVGYEEAHEIAYTDVVDVKTCVTKVGKLEQLTLTLTLVNGQELNICLRNRPTRAANYMRTLSPKERKDILESGAEFQGSTDALSPSEVEVITRVRHAIRDRK